MSSSNLPTPDFQAQINSLLAQIDDLQAKMGAPQEPTSPEPVAIAEVRHLHDRVDFNGELSHMAEMVIMHLWGHLELVHFYSIDCEDAPRIDEILGHYMSPTLNSMMDEVALTYMGLDRQVNCHKRLVFKCCLVDAFFTCHLIALPDVSTADCLNSLLYMGDLGDFLAHEMFGVSVAALMAPDTKDRPNNERKKALAFIGKRIEKAFIPAGLKATDEPQPCRIKNPLRSKDKACTAYFLPTPTSNQSELPF